MLAITMCKTAKKLTAAVMLCSFIVAGIAGAALAYQKTTKKEIAKEWTYVDDAYYSLVNTGEGFPILVKRLQNSDYDDILTNLIDTSLRPDTVAVQNAAYNPDAILPDNMLPDGSFLVENWEDLYEQLINDTYEVKTLHVTKEQQVTLEEVSTQNQKLSITDGNTNTINAKIITTKKGNIALPTNFDITNVTYMVAPDGKSVLYMTEGELVTIDGTGTTTVVSPSTYNGKTYEDLIKESIEIYGENRVFWNGQASISPDGSSIAYISNKANIQGTWDLFVLDLSTGKEEKIGDDKAMHYFVVRWLDSKYVLCMKTRDSYYELVAVGLDGIEYKLNFATKNPVILGARDGLIAYGNEANDTIYLAQFNHSEKLEKIAEFKINGTFRIRPGISPFSPDGKKFAYVSVPETNYYGRDIVVIDLETMTATSNQTIPSGTKTTTAVLEFDWLDNDSLLTSVIENSTQTITSWIYHTK